MEKLRRQIDQLDAQILELLNKRAKCVLKIGAIKQKKQTQVFVLEREIEVLNRLNKLNRGPMTEQMVLSIFQGIIDTLKDLQK